jgi:hypothetical protein
MSAGEKSKKRPAFLLTYDKSSWTIFCKCQCQQADEIQIRQVPILQEQDAGEMFAKLAQCLIDLGYKGQGVCLGIPSEAVVTAQIDAGALPRKHRQETLAYRLEEQLPLEAERLTADFIFGSSASAKALGIAVSTKEIAELIEQLSHAGIEIEAICPLALLALSALCQMREDKNKSDYVLISSNSGVNVFRMSQGRPSTWHHCSQSAGDILRVIQTDIIVNPLASPVAIVIAGQAESATIQNIEKAIPATVSRVEGDPLNLAMQSAYEIAAGKGSKKAGWVDLRQGDLAPKHAWHQMEGLLKVAAILFLAMLIVPTIAFAYRAWQYDALAGQLQKAQSAEYMRVFPNSQVPELIASRFRSELTKLSGLSGDTIGTPNQSACRVVAAGGDWEALNTLRQIVKGLPPAIKLRLNEIRITPTGALLEGQVLSHGDAAAIAEALAKAGLAVDPPRTEASPQGQFAFTINVKWLSQTQPAKLGGRQ